MNDGLELGFVAHAVGVASQPSDQAEHNRHVRHDRRVQGPQRREVERYAAGRVPPGQQEVSDKPALARVTLGVRQQAFERGNFVRCPGCTALSRAVASIAWAMTASGSRGGGCSWVLPSSGLGRAERRRATMSVDIIVRGATSRAWPTVRSGSAQVAEDASPFGRTTIRR